MAAAQDQVINGSLTVGNDVDVQGGNLTLGSTGASFGAGLFFTDADTDTLTFHLNRNPGSWLWTRNNGTGIIASMRLSLASELALYGSDGLTVGASLAPETNTLSLGDLTLFRNAGGQLRTDAVFSADSIVGGNAGLTLAAGGTNRSITFTPSGTGRVITTAPITTTATTPSTSTGTGALVVAGGLGLAGDQFIGGALKFSNGSTLVGTTDLTLSAGGTNQSIILTPSGTGAIQLNGWVGIGTVPSWPLHFVASSTTTGTDNTFGAYFEFSHTANATTSGSLAAATFVNAASGTGRAVEEIGVNANLNWSNTNSSSRGTAMLAHFQTMAGSNATAGILAGFRTSLDHNSGGAISSVYGLWVPQVDVAHGGSISSVAGVQVGNLAGTAGTGKANVWGLYSSSSGVWNGGPGTPGDPSQEQWNALQGPTMIGTNAIIGVASQGPRLVVSETNTATSGSYQTVLIAPVYNQASGSASNTDLLINRTGPTGSGTQKLLDLQTAGTSRFFVNSAGVVTVPGQLSVTSATNSTNSSSGSIVTAGGVGIAGDLHTGSVIYADGGIASTSPTTGSLVVNGGLGLSGSLSMGGAILGPSAQSFNISAAAGRSIVLSPGAGADLVLKAATMRPSANAGYLSRFETSTGVPKWGLYFPSDASVDLRLYNEQTGRDTIIFGTDDVVRIPGTTPSTTPTTGALVVSGGIGVVGDQSIGGSLRLPQGNILSADLSGLSLRSGGYGQNITLSPSGTGIVSAQAPLAVAGALSVGGSITGPTAAAFTVQASPGRNLILNPGFGADLILKTATLRPSSSGANLLRLQLSTGVPKWDLYFASDASFDLRLYNEATGHDAIIFKTDDSVRIPATTAATSSSSGALIVDGGVGVAGDVYVGQALRLAQGGTLSSSSGQVQVSPGLKIASTSTIKGVRTVLSALVFPAVAGGGGTQDLTVAVTGAAVNDSVQLGLPVSPVPGLIFQAWVSAADTVTLRATNVTGSAITPDSATYRLTVTSF